MWHRVSICSRGYNQQYSKSVLHLLIQLGLHKYTKLIQQALSSTVVQITITCDTCNSIINHKDQLNLLDRKYNIIVTMRTIKQFIENAVTVSVAHHTFPTDRQM